jgi:CelD/BcsL family acetyltransferase involved in cellulose biosynthesis
LNEFWQSVTLVLVVMTYTVTQESFDSLATYWDKTAHSLPWNIVFTLPTWLEVWWRAFGTGTELNLAVREGEEIIGLAPFKVVGETVSFIGSPDVCDYLDFIIAPGREADFFNVLLDDLKRKAISRLDLRSVRPDSTVLTNLVDITKKRGGVVLCQPEDVSFEMDLPVAWEDYLESLTTKQRHEVRRKLRRLLEAGKINYRCLKASEGLVGFMDTFLKQFVISREDKADFMTPRMEAFFRSMAGAMAKAGLLRLGVLELDTQPVAMLLGFDYNDCMYLYNSAFDPQYRELSVGLLSKVLCIKDSIEAGKKRFDFLKGNETYKHHLGGREVPIYSCQITI